MNNLPVGGLETMTAISWPIQYNVRKSKRAKRVSLRITAAGIVEVVVPHRLMFFDIPNFVEESKEWIIDRLTEMQAQVPAESAMNMPDELPLLAIDQVWRIIKQPVDVSGVKIHSKHFLELVLQGEVDHTENCRAVIKRWLQRKAKKILPPWFDEVSQRANLSYGSLRINTAKTRWGSCSVHRNINLNAKLLLLPPELVEHVMLHELCHTVHLDHSRVFWSLLGSFDSDTHQNSRLLRGYRNSLTVWLDQ